MYRGCRIFTEELHENSWIAYVRESVVCGHGDSPTAAVAHMLRVMEEMGDRALDALPLPPEV